MDAAIADLSELPYADVSSRTIAKRADVSIATFYTYFSSKEHLLAAVFRDRINEAVGQELPTAGGPRERVEAAMANIVATAFTATGLQDAWTVALLADDPDVKLLQQDYGLKLTTYLLGALGDDAAPQAQGAIMLLFAGGLLLAGQNMLPFADLPRVLGEMTELLIRGSKAA